MVSGSLISSDSSPLQSFGRCDITAHWALTCPKLWLRIASATLTPELCVFWSIVHLHIGVKIYFLGVDFLSALFVIGTHLRRLLGRTHLDRGCSSWPGSNTASKCKCVLCKHETETSFNQQHWQWAQACLTILKHSNSVWTQASRLKHKSGTLELCLNTSKPPETQVWNTWAVFEHRLPSQSIQSSSPNAKT